MKIIWTFTLLMITVGAMDVTGFSGGVVNITCKYDKKCLEKAKYFCIGKKPHKPKNKWCADLIRTKEKDKWIHSGRFSLFDDTTAAVFTVILRNVSLSDMRTYQCGVQRCPKQDSHSEVKLIVKTETTEDQTASSFTLDQSPSITPTEAGLSVIVSLSVLLLLVITVILSVIMILWRRRKRRTSNSSSSPQVSPSACDYKNTNQQLPTNPSESLTGLYSTVQKSSGDSEICISSAEDLNYAVVNFHKRPDGPDSVSLRNHQDHSEYAAVNQHLIA